MSITGKGRLHRYRSDLAVRHSDGQIQSSREAIFRPYGCIYPGQRRKYRNEVLYLMGHDKIYGMIGSVLLLPTVSTVALFCFSSYLLGTPFRIALNILANLLVLGPIGYMLGRFKPYEYTSRVFLTLAILGIVLGTIGGMIAGIAYIAYLVVKIVFGVVLIAFAGCIIAALAGDRNSKEGRDC